MVTDVPMKFLNGTSIISYAAEKKCCKVCLISGAFFETVSEIKNLTSALGDAMDDAREESRSEEGEYEEYNKAKQHILGMRWRREHLAAVRHHPDASVSLRLRVMAEIESKANILKYEELGDNTLSFVVPIDSDLESKK